MVPYGLTSHTIEKIRWATGLLALCGIVTAQAATVTYNASFETSRGNPITDIIILELDGGGTVHGLVYPYDLPGQELCSPLLLRVHKCA